MEFYLFMLALIITAVQAKPGVKQTLYNKAFEYNCRVFIGPSSTGYAVDIVNYIPDLSILGLDNAIESVLQTGMWIYYENADYNALAGSVYFIHGFGIDYTFPTDFANTATSIRYGGKPLNPNSDTWTLYEGQLFTGDEYFGETDSATIGNLDNAASSLLLTGLSPWTLYSGQYWTGDKVCVYPDTDQGDVLDFGIYPDITTLGIPDKSVRSVRKGCWGINIAKATPMKVEEGRAKNDAWGYADW